MDKQSEKSNVEQNSIFELFRILQTEPIKFSTCANRNEFFADWDQINWKDCLKVGIATQGVAASQELASSNMK